MMMDSIVKKQKLQSCTTYKFRIAAINPCGRSAWSEPVSFTTSTPGLPGTPTAIKITKVNYKILFF